jgi:hypothetical protein
MNGRKKIFGDCICSIEQAEKNIWRLQVVKTITWCNEIGQSKETCSYKWLVHININSGMCLACSSENG